jgi:hypothetical protein
MLPSGIHEKSRSVAQYGMQGSTLAVSAFPPVYNPLWPAWAPTTNAIPDDANPLSLESVWIQRVRCFTLPCCLRRIGPWISLISRLSGYVPLPSIGDNRLFL